MSFLDRLKREADQQRLQAEQLAAEREKRETLYKSQIEPKMKAMTSYLEGLAETLLEVKPPIVIRMAIQGYGDLCTVPFWDYKVEHERRHRSFAITMTWSLRVDAERTPVVRADGVTRVKALTGVFRQYHLGGIKEEKRTPQGELSCATFHARGYIKARMEATISADDPVLRLMFDNASWLGASRRQVPFELIDDNLFDRIGRFVVREDDSLFTEELSDALKQKLRKDPEPATAASTSAMPPSERVAPAASAPAPVAPPPSQPPPAADVEPTYSPGSVAALAPMMQGEMIEIDESKLGLADFTAPDEPISVFSSAAMNSAKPAPKPEPPAAIAAVGTIPAPPPVGGGEVIPIDESKLGFGDEPTPIVIERTPAIAPSPQSPAPAAPSPPIRPAPPASPPAALATPSPQPPAPRPAAPVPAPAVAAAAPTAPVAAALAAATIPQRATAPSVADAGAAVSLRATPASPPAAAVATPAPATPVADGNAPAAVGEEVDEAKEREAALFRLRMRAMLARLRSDEQEEGKG